MQPSKYTDPDNKIYQHEAKSPELKESPNKTTVSIPNITESIQSYVMSYVMLQSICQKISFEIILTLVFFHPS